MEQKLAEERAAKLRLENRILEQEKHSSMMDCDYKQALQKLDELRRHKDRLTEEASVYNVCRASAKCSFRTRLILQLSLDFVQNDIKYSPTLSPLCSVYQVKNLTLKIEQEMQKRTLTQNDLKAQTQQFNALRTSEKQLKQETNHLLDIKRSLEKQNQELRKSV